MAIEPRNALVPKNCLSKELGRVIEMEFLGDLPGFKSSGKDPEDLQLAIAEAFCRRETHLCGDCLCTISGCSVS